MKRPYRSTGSLSVSLSHRPRLRRRRVVLPRSVPQHRHTDGVRLPVPELPRPDVLRGLAVAPTPRARHAGGGRGGLPRRGVSPAAGIGVVLQSGSAEHQRGADVGVCLSRGRHGGLVVPNPRELPRPTYDLGSPDCALLIFLSPSAAGVPHIVILVLDRATMTNWPSTLVQVRSCTNRDVITDVYISYACLHILPGLHKHESRLT